MSSSPQDPEARLDRLEALVLGLAETVESLNRRSSAPPAPPAPEGKTTSTSISPASSASSPAASADPASSPATPADPALSPGTDAESDPFWALTALKERVPAPGAVVYAGAIDVGIGHVEYQWGRPTDPLLRADWAERAERIAALGHPLRLSMLQLLLDGERTVAQLVDELDLASTGVAYHHLNQLQSAGWVASPHRGAWEVPVARVVPLLAIITASETI